jgi:hypothetical protein
MEETAQSPVRKGGAVGNLLQALCRVRKHGGRNAARRPLGQPGEGARLIADFGDHVTPRPARYNKARTVKLLAREMVEHAGEIGRASPIRVIGSKLDPFRLQRSTICPNAGCPQSSQVRALYLPASHSGCHSVLPRRPLRRLRYGPSSP